MLQRNIDKLYPRKTVSISQGCLCTVHWCEPGWVVDYLSRLPRLSRDTEQLLLSPLCVHFESQVNDLNIPIGCKHCGQDLTREYAGKAQLGVPRLRYENYNFAHVVVTGEYHRVDALPNPRIETQSPL